MNAKKFTTPEQCDQRFVWLDTQILIEQEKANDTTNPTRDKAAARVKNLKHEKTLLEKRKQFLLTPALL